MSLADRRLKKIEAALPPAEAFAVWLQDVRVEDRSLAELARSYQGQPDEAFPLYALTSQAEVAARARLRSETAKLAGLRQLRADYREQGERAAVREIATLFYLFVDVNGRFLEEKRALCLLVALALSSLKDCFSDRRLAKAGEPIDRRFAALLEELYGWQQAVATLSERYFQGVCPLLPETEEELAWIVAQGELAVELFNDHLEWEIELRKDGGKRKPRLPKPLDLAALKRSAEPRAKATVAYLVDLARAEACDMMGERSGRWRSPSGNCKARREEDAGCVVEHGMRASCTAPIPINAPSRLVVPAQRAST